MEVAQRKELELAVPFFSHLKQTVMTLPPTVSDLLDLRGKAALVTGASAGIGRGVATRLSEAGAAVAVHYRGGKEDAEALASTLRGKGRKGLSVHAELTDPQSVETAIGTITDELGAIDILVNNAARQTHAGFEEMSLEEWRAMMATNLDGVFIVTHAVVAGMIARGSGGAIVNIASIEGLQPAPTHGHYAVSKAGLIMFTRAAALQYGKHGIRVNAVSPGVIRRDGIEQGWPEGVARWMKAAPLGRMGEDEDVADAVLFLASQASRWITGANLVVDGGVTSTPAF
jgi:NAD(P)-dependent dehydrogenase (short-subunit alcohol dehydrogenase family)